MINYQHRLYAMAIADCLSCYKDDNIRSHMIKNALANLNENKSLQRALFLELSHRRMFRDELELN